MHHVFLIHSSVDEHLGCFHILGTVSSAAVNTGVHDLWNHGFLQINDLDWDSWIIC